MTLKGIVEQLRMCGYVCEAGPLENNVAFIELVKMAENYERHRQIREMVDRVDVDSIFNPCKGGHVFIWVSAGTTVNGEPPIGTRCACGATEYQGGSSAMGGVLFGMGGQAQ